MTPMTSVDDRPSGRQLAYLKSLATRTEQTFAWPQTRAQASREIRRLKSVPAAQDLPSEFDLDAEEATREANADVPVQAFEIAGFSRRDVEPAVMTTATVTETRRNGNPVGDVGERVELARYVVPAGERVIYGQRVNGVVRVTDVPSSGRGRAYLVERGLELDGYDALKALVSDYVSQSQALADVPMAVSPLTGTRTEDLQEAER